MELKINTINDFKRIIRHEPYYGNPILPYSQEEDFEELKNILKINKGNCWSCTGSCRSK